MLKNQNLDAIKSTIVLIQKVLDKMISEGKTNAYENELTILELYPEFYNSYPFLVKKICKQQDITMLFHMLEKLDEIKEGNITLEKVEYDLGQQLYKKYVTTTKN
jgi:hypothetical protein